MGASCSNINIEKQVCEKSSNVPHEFGLHYDLGRTIGNGNYATVRLATNKFTKQRVAVKVVKKEGLLNIDAMALLQEAEIMKTIDHPNIVKCLDFFDEKNHYFVVLEYMKGGELLDRIIERKKYTEEDARNVIKLVLNALKHLHDKNIVHRDIKPENLLLTCTKCDHDIKIADFGFASMKGDLMSTQVGTPDYLAPEIIDGKPYSKGVDMWAVGCVTYVLLSGTIPFESPNLKSLFRVIRKGEFSFPEETWGNISSEAKNFISQLLKVDPEDRMNIDDAMMHPWLKVSDEDLRAVMLDHALSTSFNSLRSNKSTRSTHEVPPLERDNTFCSLDE